MEVQNNQSATEKSHSSRSDVIAIRSEFSLFECCPLVKLPVPTMPFT